MRTDVSILTALLRKIGTIQNSAWKVQDFPKLVTVRIEQRSTPIHPVVTSRSLKIVASLMRILVTANAKVLLLDVAYLYTPVYLSSYMPTFVKHRITVFSWCIWACICVALRHITAINDDSSSIIDHQGQLFVRWRCQVRWLSVWTCLSDSTAIQICVRRFVT